jgi:hypothetical protein
MNNVLTINSKLQQIEYIQKNINTTGFIFNKFSENYIISVHHGLPIEKCNVDTTKLNIIKDCIWNELLVLKSTTELNTTYTNYRKVKYKIPNITEELYIKLNDRTITLKNGIYINIHLHDIPTNPKIPYIKLDIYDGEVEESMSGSPIVDKNNYLIGILSKKDNTDKTVYIIPSYILIKTLTKTNGIYDIIDDIEDINKINDIKVKDNLILHKSMNITIPISTYFLIEGDIETSVKINNEFYRFIDISDKLYINNTNTLLNIKSTTVELLDNIPICPLNNTKYEITIRLLKLIRLYFSEISSDVFKILKENFKNKIHLYINVKRISSKIKYYEFNILFDEKNINLKFIVN